MKGPQLKASRHKRVGHQVKSFVVCSNKGIVGRYSIVEINPSGRDKDTKLPERGWWLWGSGMVMVMEDCGALTVLIITTLILCIHRPARQVGEKLRITSTGLSSRLISSYTVSFQMGFSAGSSSLSDKTRYPLFFRVNAPETTLYTAVVSLLHRFNWKRIAIVKQDEDLFNDVSENYPYLVLVPLPRGKEKGDRNREYRGGGG